MSGVEIRKQENLVLNPSPPETELNFKPQYPLDVGVFFNIRLSRDVSERSERKSAVEYD